MPLPLVIINPSSASGSTGETWPGVASDLRSEFGSFQTAFTKVRGDATAIANDAARKGVKFIIACGGDGTVSEVANGILSSGKDAELGISQRHWGRFPPFARNPIRQPRGRARVAGRQNTPHRVGRISFRDHNGAETMRYFVGVSSCGLSTKVIRRKSRRTRLAAAQVARWAYLLRRVATTNCYAQRTDAPAGATRRCTR